MLRSLALLFLVAAGPAHAFYDPPGSDPCNPGHFPPTTCYGPSAILEGGVIAACGMAEAIENDSGAPLMKAILWLARKLGPNIPTEDDIKKDSETVAGELGSADPRDYRKWLDDLPVGQRLAPVNQDGATMVVTVIRRNERFQNKPGEFTADLVIELTEGGSTVTFPAALVADGEKVHIVGQKRTKRLKR